MAARHGGAPRARRGIVALGALALAISLWLLAAPRAEAGERIEGSCGRSGPGAGELVTPRDVAVNDSSTVDANDGDIYVAEFGNRRVSQFTEDCEFKRVWGWGVANGEDEFQICTASCRAGVALFGSFPPPAPGGSFEALQALGIDQSSGDVYVHDRGNQRIQRFGPDGEFIAAYGWEVDKTGGPGGLESCTVSEDCRSGASGSEPGQLGATTNRLDLEVGPEGTVYASDPLNRRVQAFTPDGEFLFMVGTGVNQTDEVDLCTAADVTAGDTCGAGKAGATLFSTSTWLAVGDDGTLYAVDRASGLVRIFDSEGNHLKERSEALNEALATQTATFADISAGNLIVAETIEGELAIEEWDPEANGGEGEVIDTHLVGEALPPMPTGAEGMGASATSGRKYLVTTLGGAKVLFLGPEGPTAPTAAIDPFTELSANGVTANATIDPNGEPEVSYRFEFSSNGGATYDPGPLTLLGAQEDPQEVSFRYEPAGDLVPETAYLVRLKVSREYGPGAEAAGGFESPGPAPTPSTGAATAITDSSATLNGTLDPEGAEAGECTFLYGTTTAYGQSVSCSQSPAEIGAGSSPVPVSAPVEGLTGGTVYHFRLIAANANGDATGKDATFKTPGPSLEGSWVSEVTQGEATLNALVNPEGKATEVRFEYGSADCAANPCTSTPPLQAGSGKAAKALSFALEGLDPGAAYHWRAIATGPDGTATGPERILRTYRHPGLDGCANAHLRSGPAARLADCRGYELVTPVDKGGGDIFSRREFRQASTDGERLTYTSSTAFGDSLSARVNNQYLASRGAGGWASHGLNSAQGETPWDPEFFAAFERANFFQAFTPDLCHALVKDQNAVPLTEDAIPGYENGYLRDNCDPGADTYKALFGGELLCTIDPGGITSIQAPSYSDDVSRVFFSVRAALEAEPLSAGCDGSAQLYERNFAEGPPLRLVSVLPSGFLSVDTNAIGTGQAAGGATLADAVSADGSRVFWTASPGGFAVPGKIYAHVDGHRTLAVSEPVTADAARFWTADTQGSRAIFSIVEKALEGNLYEFDVDKALAAGEEAAVAKIAGQVGGVVGASEDLSHLYFTSEEALASGASEGEWNLYLRRESGGGAELVFIAALAAADRSQGGGGIDEGNVSIHASRVSPDGRHLAFMSQSPALAESVAGYDNADAASGEAASEIYRYHAPSGELACVSCNPSGARPATRERGSGGGKALVAAWLVGWEKPNHETRTLSADGQRVFFNSFDPLVPEDSNEAQDVYQWEAPGSGDCSPSSARYSPLNEGCVSLLSTGANGADSAFVDADEDGSDAFFATDSRIDPRDPGLIDIYDARVGGGFPPPPPPSETCQGDSCQDVPSPPPYTTPSSAASRGPGDPRPAADCRARARRAAALARKARAARRAARRSAPARRAQRRRARRLARKAARWSKAARRCRAQRKGGSR